MTGSGLREHTSRAVLEHLQRLEACRDFATANDPVETLHDLRVASRRLRAFVDVFEPALGSTMHDRLRKHLRRILRSLRALRDLDVQTALLTGRLGNARTAVERAAIEHLLERASSKRSKEGRRVAKRERKLDYDSLAVSIESALDRVSEYLSNTEPETPQLVMAMLEPALARLERAHPPADGTEHVEELHRMRLGAKKMRYALELFEPVLGNGHSALQRRLRLLQDVLGTHHDLFELESLVDRSRAELDGRHRTTLAHGLSILGTELSRERRATFERFREARFTPDEWRAKVGNALLPRRRRSGR